MNRNVLPWRFFGVLALIAADIYSLIWLGHRIGGWTWLYLIATFWLGSRLMGSWRQVLTGSLQASIAAGTPMRAVLRTVRVVLAGVLLIFPGLLSDIAGVFLLLPWGKSRPRPVDIGATDEPPFAQSFAQADAARAAETAHTPGTVEGEYRRVD